MKKDIKQVKKGLAAFLTVVMVMCAAPLGILAADISVTVNGAAVNFTGQKPVNVNGSILVPVRGVFEVLDFEVSWNSDLRQATLARVNDIIVIAIDSPTFTTNGISHTLDVPAQLIGGSTMLPLRSVLESVGCTLAWDGDTQTVVITTQAPNQLPPEPAPQPTPGTTGQNPNQDSGITISDDIPEPLAGDSTPEDLISRMDRLGVAFEGLIDGRPFIILSDAEVDKLQWSLSMDTNRRVFVAPTVYHIEVYGYLFNVEGVNVYLVYGVWQDTGGW